MQAPKEYPTWERTIPIDTHRESLMKCSQRGGGKGGLCQKKEGEPLSTFRGGGKTGFGIRLRTDGHTPLRGFVGERKNAH